MLKFGYLTYVWVTQPQLDMQMFCDWKIVFDYLISKTIMSWICSKNTEFILCYGGRKIASFDTELTIPVFAELYESWVDGAKEERN